jgi:diphosphomevalonate decarboxylase
MYNIDVAYESPSNIAIIKYWGKKEIQLPLNPSFSFTLSNSITSMHINVISNNFFDVEFYFDEIINEKFGLKVKNKLKEILDLFPWLNKSKLTIYSSNTFPHSAGIASSASSMSALALCLCEIDYKMKSHINSFFELTDENLKIASTVARLLSGSAARSLFPIGSIWGNNEIVANSSDLYASKISSKIHPIFKDLNDAILIVSDQEKTVSSSDGHRLMDNHVHRQSRIANANVNFSKLMTVLRDGDFEKFSEIAEMEALDLHAMMFTSNPSFILLSPNSLLLIQEIRKFRTDKKIPITFTIDAGPNIHVLYPEIVKDQVNEFLNLNFLKPNIVKKIIFDKVGFGPKRINCEPR